jgi:hypothetical protein
MRSTQPTVSAMAAVEKKETTLSVAVLKQQPGPLRRVPDAELQKAVATLKTHYIESVEDVESLQRSDDLEKWLGDTLGRLVFNAFRPSPQGVCPCPALCCDHVLWRLAPPRCPPVCPFRSLCPLFASLLAGPAPWHLPSVHWPSVFRCSPLWCPALPTVFLVLWRCSALARCFLFVRFGLSALHAHWDPPRGLSFALPYSHYGFVMHDLCCGFMWALFSSPVFVWLLPPPLPSFSIPFLLFCSCCAVYSSPLQVLHW